MAKHFGGVREDSTDSGHAAFKALMIGGSSGFNGVLGGGLLQLGFIDIGNGQKPCAAPMSIARYGVLLKDSSCADNSDSHGVHQGPL